MPIAADKREEREKEKQEMPRGSRALDSTWCSTMLRDRQCCSATLLVKVLQGAAVTKAMPRRRLPRHSGSPPRF